jgi:hypothetical protein
MRAHSPPRSEARPRHSAIRVLAFAITLAVALASTSARAEESLHLGVDWGKLDEVLRNASGPLTLGAEPERPQSALMRTVPRMSIVARDWGASQPLFGPLGPTDQLRLSRSLRMVVARLRLGGGRIAPFAQIGFGQWRVDTSVVAMPNDEELAGQVGGGLELHVVRGVVVALEGSCTMLYREGSERVGLPLVSPNLWGGLLAARARF